VPSDVDECRQNPCSNGRCENTPGSYRCVCHHGYKPQNNTCTDVDECAEPSQCPGQMCVNSVGSYRCVSCRAGFRLTDRQCTGTHTHTRFHIVVRTSPCRAFPNPQPNLTCEDGDSCPGQRCVNTEGSYRCVDCRQGYHSVDGVCTDINECLEGDFCFSRGECVNTPGSYTCVCSQGFTLSENRTACLGESRRSNGERLSGRFFGFVRTSVFRCLSISFIPQQPHDRRRKAGLMSELLCGIYYSQVQKSFTPVHFVFLCLCADVDECVKAGVCSDGRCVNTEGSFQCDCQIGFTTNPEGTARPGELRECYYNLAERGTCSLLATNTTQQECCCTLGQGWGLGCQYHPCPTAYTAEFLTLCPSGNGYVTEGPGAFSYRDVDECKRFHPEVCKNGVCVNNIPGYSCYCSSGYVYNSTLLECVDHDECEEESCVGGICVNTVGSYYCSCQPPLVLDDTQRNCVNSSDLNQGKPELPKYPLLSIITETLFCFAFSALVLTSSCSPDENLSICWQHVTTGLVCQSVLMGAHITFTDCCCLYGQGWGFSCALCPAPDTAGELAETTNTVKPAFSFSHLSGRYESYASLSTAEDCGILHGCENGRCIRVAEGYTCDCYQGYELDMTTMTCIDVNECEDSIRIEYPCVNARCVNTDGSYRCVCRRGYVMSRRPNHCVAA
uniref:Latent-transforming growth factor beta-binding protein 4 n=1 Tax=Haplochromis burtoni TaxID=8153 RepID=A0A3Q2WZQ1_HAPBU